MAEAAAAGALCARGEEEAGGKGGVEALVVPAAEEEGAEDDGGGDEEEEEEQTEEEDLKQRGYDAGVRERELANQKARIVSQMAKERVDGEPVERRTPRKLAAAPATVSAGLSPARTVEAPRREPTSSGTTGKMGQVASGRVSLFDVFADTLDRALSSPSTFSTSRESPKQLSQSDAC